MGFFGQPAVGSTAGRNSRQAASSRQQQAAKQKKKGFANAHFKGFESACTAEQARSRRQQAAASSTAGSQQAAFRLTSKLLAHY